MPEEKGEGINFRRWISRVFGILIILLLMTYTLQQYLNIPLLFDILITLIAILFLFFLHEYLHYFVAIRLGYKPEWYRTRFMMGFDIDTKIRTEKAMEKEIGLSPKQKKVKHIKENKKIAIAPYTICVPLTLVFVILGYTFGVNGLIYAGVLGLIGHLFTFTKEAKILE